MCDPISAIALAGSAVSAGIGYMGQQDAVNAQNQANQDWEATQQAAAAKASQQDEANRQKQMAALSTAQQKLSPQSMQDAQQTAQNTLNTQMLAGSPAAPNSNVQLLGQPAGGATTSVTTDMANRVTDAAREAQGRIKALAGINSYGSGYQGAQGQAQGALQDSGEAINMYGDMRKGDTATLGVTQQIQPLQYAPGANIAGSVAGMLGGMAGKGMSGALAKATAPV